jgi:hypothetical protein
METGKNYNENPEVVLFNDSITSSLIAQIVRDIIGYKEKNIRQMTDKDWFDLRESRRALALTMANIIEGHFDHRCLWCRGRKNTTGWWS